MRPFAPIALCMTLAVAAADPATAQYGLGLGQGFTGAGLGNWVLYEGGADSLAAWYQLTEEQRGQLESLAAQFRSENADAVARWEQMQREIQALWTGNQPPTWAAINAVGEKYGHPGQELQPALDQLQQRFAALLPPIQRQFFGRRAFGGMGRGRGFASRRFGTGYRGFRGRPGFNSWRGWRRPEN
ncbi:MAG: hypothetical protein AMS18_16960 [Gemmatimonas sp. SG8_17]|nr:MAG: hypothetical protein AMS18_16960 [Gemmatimonas sp. SG8_17]